MYDLVRVSRDFKVATTQNIQNKTKCKKLQAIFCIRTARFVSELVENSKNKLSQSYLIKYT